MDVRFTPSHPFRDVNDGEDLVARLEAEFTQEQLEASGVMRRGADGQLTWARPLGPPGSVVAALREGEGQGPFGLVTPSGGLVGHDVPVLSTLRDHRTGKWLPKTDGRLFVCASTEQIPVFRSVYLQATTSAGLMDLNGAQLQELSQRLGWNEPSTSENMASATGPVNLTLVNWHPETLSAEQCVEIRQVAQFLARVERCLHIDMSRCVVWSPTEIEIDRCEEQFDGSPSSENCRRRAQAAYEDRVEADLLGPLEEHVAESGDPWEMNLGMLTAESLRLLHRQVPLLRQIVAKLVRDPSSQRDQKGVMEQLKDRERQIASVTRLVKVLRG